MRYQPWFKLMADLPARKAHYDDEQFRAYIEVMCAAALSREPGSFPSMAAVRRVTGEADFLVEQGDLDVAEDGVVSVHGWSKYQRPFDEGHAERQSRYRDRQRDVTKDEPSRDASSASSPERHFGSSTTTSSIKTTKTKNESSEVDAREDPLDAVWQLTGRYPSGKVRVWVDSLTETYGERNVIAALAEAHGQDPVKFIGLAEDLLKRGAVKAEQAERDRKAREKTEAQHRPKTAPTPIGGWDVDGAEYDALQAELRAKREATNA